MEEYDFLAEMCFVALDISKEVKFAAVIDSNGKMITGKQSKNNYYYYYINNGLDKTRLLHLSSVTQDNVQNSLSISFCHYNTNCLLYKNYLTTILEKIENEMQQPDKNTEQKSAHPIEIVRIHGLLKIAVTPLTANNDRYLCIYLELS